MTIPPRFTKGYKAGKKNECWLWQRAITNSGYGSLGAHGHTQLAHRVAWKFHRGSIPDGLCVLHKCDVRACVNPDHLFLGTVLDNNADRHAKGRSNTARGIQNGNVKLTEYQVLKIRKDQRPAVAVAAHYKISDALVSYIRKRKAWRHLP